MENVGLDLESARLGRHLENLGAAELREIKVHHVRLLEELVVNRGVEDVADWLRRRGGQTLEVHVVLRAQDRELRRLHRLVGRLVGQQVLERVRQLVKLRCALHATQLALGRALQADQILVRT